MKLQIQDIDACHPSAPTGGIPAIKRMSLTIQAGEQVALIGPSGAGKTTLLQVLACTLKPLNGEFKVTDLITGQKFVWGEHNYVRLDSFTEPAHILRVES